MITFVSGNQDAVSAITPIFEIFSRDIYNFGEEITTAINSKIMANYVAVSAFELIAELLVFSERNKLDPEILAGILENFYCSPSILNCYKKMQNHDFDKVNFTVNGGLKDSKVYIQAFKDVKVQAKFAEILHDRFVNAKRLGLEHKDWSAIYEVICRASQT